jgi:hypothetical protein
VSIEIYYYFYYYSYSTNPHEMVQFYQPSIITSAMAEATYLLTKLQSLVMSVELPQVKRSLNYKLERGQQDITTDPKKVLYMHP